MDGPLLATDAFSVVSQSTETDRQTDSDAAQQMRFAARRRHASNTRISRRLADIDVCPSVCLSVCLCVRVRVVKKLRRMLRRALTPRRWSGVTPRTDYTRAEPAFVAARFIDCAPRADYKCTTTHTLVCV